MDDAAVSLLRKVSERKPLTEDECVYLLGFPEDSPEADMTVCFADRLSRIANDNTGEIGAQIGIITGPCIADCGFCKYAVRRMRTISSCRTIPCAIISDG